MSKAIAKLLNAPEHLVVDMVRKLEDMNGSPSEDVRLISENQQKIRVKLSQLGLDPDDTTGEELYQALKAQFANDCSQLDKAWGIDEQTSLAKRVIKATQLVAGLGPPPEIWALKHSAAKKLLRQTPPKKLMKKLGYRSLESLLKHEDIGRIYLAAVWLEPHSWQSTAGRKIAKLDTAGFEMRGPQITALPKAYWQNVDGPKSHVLLDRNIGAVALWPAGMARDSQVLPLAIMLLSSVEKLAGADFGSKLYNASPVLRWWADNARLISDHRDGPVSLNIKDLSRDFLKNNTYSSRSSKHGAGALLNELLGRYQNQSEQLADTIRGIGYNLDSLRNDSLEAPLATRLAAEYSLQNN
jgi:hypothetical protein